MSHLHKVHFHGSLEHPIVEMYGDTIHEIIEGVSRQVAVIGDRKLIEIKGVNVEEDLYRFLDEPEDIHIYPALIGAKSKFTQVLVGATLIALSFAIPGSIALFGTQFALSTYVAQFGAMMLLGGIAQLLSPQPETDESSNKKSGFMSGNRNTVAIGTPIPILYGEFRCGGHYLSFDVNSGKGAIKT